MQADIMWQVVEASGLSKAELHRRSGVSRALLNDYLSGAKKPTLAQIQRLADAAGVGIEVVVTAPQPAPQPVPDLAVAVLELADELPHRPKPPLPNLSPLWATARQRACAS